jgi:hypothetical protein
MDVVAANKVEALKNEKMGPPGPCSSRSGSQYSMSRTYGTRDIISLVIPKLGDNRAYKGVRRICNSASRKDQGWKIYVRYSKIL